MSTYDLEEQEQLAALKAWWQQYGNLVVTAITLILAGFAAWNGWQWYQQSQSMQAASHYENLQKAARLNDAKAVRDSAGAILEQYPRSAYAPLAALVAAKINFQAGDLKTTKAQLQWVVDHAKTEELRSVAKLRLAGVLLDEGAPEGALKLLSDKPAVGFDSLFALLRGDVYVAQKKASEARAAYQLALDKADKRDRALREQIRLKLEALGA